MLETVCVPKTKEGRWISRLELVDSDAVDVKTDESLVAYGSSSLKKLDKKSTYLLVKQHDVYGHCEEECETIAKTCVDLTDEKVLGSGFGWGRRCIAAASATGTSSLREGDVKDTSRSS